VSNNRTAQAPWPPTTWANRFSGDVRERRDQPGRRASLLSRYIATGKLPEPLAAVVEGMPTLPPCSVETANRLYANTASVVGIVEADARRRKAGSRDANPRLPAAGHSIMAQPGRPHLERARNQRPPAPQRQDEAGTSRSSQAQLYGAVGRSRRPANPLHAPGPHQHKGTACENLPVACRRRSRRIDSRQLGAVPPFHWLPGTSDGPEEGPLNTFNPRCATACGAQPKDQAAAIASARPGCAAPGTWRGVGGPERRRPWPRRHRTASTREVTDDGVVSVKSPAPSLKDGYSRSNQTAAAPVVAVPPAP